MTTNTKRWEIRNINTGKTRVAKITRDLARAVKKANERIFDSYNGVYVR